MSNMPLSHEVIDAIDRAAGLMRGADRLLVITGAGVSADSGLPTYRGIGGLYNDAVTEEGLPIEEALAGDTLELNPPLTWKYLARIEEACRGAHHNRAHEVIALMESRFDRVWVLTQNIDGFHQAAGSTRVIDIHGDMHSLSCMDCEHTRTVTDYGALDIPPRCPDCGGYLRPDVVLFGEMLPWDRTNRMIEAWENGVDMVFSIGTTSVFPYISQPVALARENGIPTVEINPGETAVSGIVDIRVRARAAVALDELWRRFGAV